VGCLQLPANLQFQKGGVTAKKVTEVTTWKKTSTRTECQGHQGAGLKCCGV